MTEATIERAEESITDAVVLRAIGDELELARKAKGWSRSYLAERMPSGIGDRSVLSYERGTRTATIWRFIEICRALDVSPVGLLRRALQRARICLEKLELLVDLPTLIDDQTPRYLPLRMWAENKLKRHGQRVAELPPAAVDELADFLDCSRDELARYLARFVPDDLPPADDLPAYNVIASRLLRAAS